MKFAKEAEDLKRQLEVLKSDNYAFKEETDSEKRKNVALLDQLKDRDRRLKEMSNDLDNMKSSPMAYRAKSKSPSLASVNSEQWPDEVFESRGIQNDGLRMLIGASGSSSALLESLQSQLKQREVRNYFGLKLAQLGDCNSSDIFMYQTVQVKVFGIIHRQ